ncbi:MAG: MBL fold metallo-hydrolase [Mollicutes bacterium]|nr:MBL fold metallo-hydrolase [Mollicutes bacterium]
MKSKVKNLLFIIIMFFLLTTNVYSSSFVMCHDNGIVKALRIIAIIINVAKILVPSFLIIIGMKSLITSMLNNDDDLKKELKKFVIKVLVGIFVFFIPTISNAFIGSIEAYDKSKSVFTDCSLCLNDANYCDNLLSLYPEEPEDLPNRHIDLNLEGLAVNPTTVGPVASGTFEVHMIAVGNGDAILIRSDSAVALLDAGPINTANKVVKYIKDLGVTKIDVVIPSHYDGDHTQGLPAVFKNFPVSRAYIQTDKLAKKGGNKALDPLRNFAKKVKAGDVLNFKEFSIKVVGPMVMTKDCLNRGYPCSNYDSINLLITFGDTKFLFTGDFVQPDRMIKRFGREEFENVDFVKQPHHGLGGNMTKRLIDIMKPKIVFVPDRELHLTDREIRWYNRVGATIYRTSKNKNLVAVSDGKNIKVTTKANPSNFKR